MSKSDWKSRYTATEKGVRAVTPQQTIKSLSATLPINPFPAVRMTLGQVNMLRRGMTTRNKAAARYLDLKEHASYLLLNARTKSGLTPFTGDVEVSLRFERTGKRRADVDNLAKAILDALQGAGIIANDNQVTKLTASVEYGCENGRIHLELREAGC